LLCLLNSIQLIVITFLTSAKEAGYFLLEFLSAGLRVLKKLRVNFCFKMLKVFA